MRSVAVAALAIAAVGGSAERAIASTPDEQQAGKRAKVEAQGQANGALAAIAQAGRARININPDWRFTLGDIPDGQRPGFDDARWQRTGLPHSFSMPYFQARSFYEGYGWYRKHLNLPALPKERRLALEFEAAFQDAEIFVNGVKVGGHRGGYTGFPVDITDAVRPGDNVIAVRLNNNWDPTLAPRAGEHVFSGGIYRDVWLVATDAVRVPWYGTYVTTPELSDASGRVAVSTEVRNDDARAVQVTAHTELKGPDGATVAILPDRAIVVQPGTLGKIAQLSAPIARPLLWSPKTPVLYRAVTTLSVGGKERDSYETSFGFRTIKWTADKGFFLNGKHHYFKGANVHQDQAGWGDAVTNGAITRDIQMVKEAGFDFIRGSHYPHDPHFAAETDRQGLLLMSENAFWGVGGYREGGKWASPAYPKNPAHKAAFDASVKQQLREMIRIFRNHPSVVLWSMDNEVFFSDDETMPDVRRLLKELVAITHEEDPSRPASVSGAQRGDIDKLGDVAAYNGDGAKLFLNPGIPNLVSEYGWTITHRPGKYEADFGDLAKTDGLGTLYDRPWHYDWRSGEVLWCAFDHGSIAGRDFGSMSIIDYARLPKRAWYWYRNAYAGVAPPQWPQEGVPVALRVTSSAPVIAAADGTDDVQLVVTVVDKDGNALSNSPPVTLSIESGPGELPTGRSIKFASDSDIPMLDGKAAIAMRSWNAGVTRVRATSPNLMDGVLEVVTTDGPAFVPGVTPVAADRPYVPFDGGEVEKAMNSAAVFGTNNPTDASSSASGSSPRLAADGKADTFWSPASSDKAPWLDVDPEKILLFKQVELTFPQAAAYGVTVEARDEKGNWVPLAKRAAGAGPATTKVTLDTAEAKGRRVRIRLQAPQGVAIGVAEVRITGIPQG